MAGSAGNVVEVVVGGAVVAEGAYAVVVGGAVVAEGAYADAASDPEAQAA